MKVQSLNRYAPAGSEEMTRDNLPGVVYANWDDLSAKGYRGKSSKPAFYYIFRNKVQMEKYINQFFDGIAAHEERKKTRREERKNYVPTLKPGDILYTSWGYEQTNVEFFQVIEIKKKTAILREIAGSTTESGMMCGYTRPVKNHYIGEPITKRVSQGDSVRIDSVRNAYPLNDKEQVYCSWYH